MPYTPTADTNSASSEKPATSIMMKRGTATCADSRLSIVSSLPMMIRRSQERTSLRTAPAMLAGGTAVRTNTQTPFPQSAWRLGK